MDAINIVQAYEQLRREYREARAEAKACGYDLPPFEHWAGLIDPKAKAQETWFERAERDELDLY